MNGLGDPLGVGVTSNSLVGRIDEDDLVELIGRIFANPVRVQHAKPTTATTNTLLKNIVVKEANSCIYKTIV